MPIEAVDDWYIRLIPTKDTPDVAEKSYSLSRLIHWLDDHTAVENEIAIVDGGVILGRKVSVLTPSKNSGEFASPIISRSHAQLNMSSGGQVYLTDLKSTHGTRIVASTSMAVSFFGSGLPGSAEAIQLEPYRPLQLFHGDTIILGKPIHHTTGDRHPPIRLRVHFHYPEFSRGTIRGERRRLGLVKRKLGEGIFASGRDLSYMDLQIRTTPTWRAERLADAARKIVPSILPSTLKREALDEAAGQIPETALPLQKDTPKLSSLPQAVSSIQPTRDRSTDRDDDITILTKESGPTAAPYPNAYRVPDSILYMSDDDEILPRGSDGSLREAQKIDNGNTLESIDAAYFREIYGDRDYSIQPGNSFKHLSPIAPYDLDVHGEDDAVRVLRSSSLPVEQSPGGLVEPKIERRGSWKADDNRLSPRGARKDVRGQSIERMGPTDIAAISMEAQIGLAESNSMGAQEISLGHISSASPDHAQFLEPDQPIPVSSEHLHIIEVQTDEAEQTPPIQTSVRERPEHNLDVNDRCLGNCSACEKGQRNERNDYDDYGVYLYNEEMQKEALSGDGFSDEEMSAEGTSEEDEEMSEEESDQSDDEDENEDENDDENDSDAISAYSQDDSMDIEVKVEVDDEEDSVGERDRSESPLTPEPECPPAIWTHDTNLEASDDEASIKSDARLRIGHLTEQLLSTSSAPLSDTNDKEPSEMIAPLVSAEDELAQSHEANNEACVTNQQHQASVIRCEGTGEAGSNISLGVPNVWEGAISCGSSSETASVSNFDTHSRASSISDSSTAGPITPSNTSPLKRSLPDEFSKGDPTAKKVEFEPSPMKAARSIGSTIGLVLLGAAVGSVGTIAGLMQLSD